MTRIYDFIDTRTEPMIMEKRLLDFATRPIMLRTAIARHEAWIAEQLGIPISECVIVESPFNAGKDP